MDALGDVPDDQRAFVACFVWGGIAVNTSGYMEVDCRLMCDADGCKTMGVGTMRGHRESVRGRCGWNFLITTIDYPEAAGWIVQMDGTLFCSEKCARGGYPKTTCKDHTPTPQGYVQHHTWMEAMKNRGKTQHQCDECNLWAIWRDKRGIVRKHITLTVKELND